MRAKRLVSTALIVLLFISTISMISVFLVPKVYAPPSFLYVLPQTNVYDIGQEFTVDLNVSSATGTRSYELNLGFDVGILYTDTSMIEEGTWLNGNGARPTIFPTSVMGNTITITCLITSYNWATGGGNLAKVRFRVVSNGKVDLHLFGIMFRDKDYNPLATQPTPVDGVFYTTYPRASFYYLPSTTAGNPGYTVPSYLIRDPVLGDVISFNASAYTSGSIYRGSYDPDGTITDYSWDFGDGNITAGNYPVITHTYQAIGTYHAILTVTDNSTRTSSYDTNVSVLLRDVAISNIEVSPTLVSPGEIVSINVNITNLGTKGGTEYVNVTLFHDTTLIWYNQTRGLSAWANVHEIDPISRSKPMEFVQGQSIMLNYTWDTTGLSAGNYTIWANISLVDQSAQNFLKDVYLKELDFNTLNNNMTFGNVTLSTTLHNIAVTDISLVPVLKSPNIISYGANEVEVAVKVENTGEYNETFYLTLHQDSNLLYNWTTVNLASKSTTTLNYTWNPSTLARGNYTLTAQANNLTDEARTLDNRLAFQIVITSAPTATFTYSPAKPLISDIIGFNATSSQAALGWTIAQYAWRINGTLESTMTTVTPQHVFRNKGTYNITLTVTDSIGITGTTSNFIHVGMLPVSRFTISLTAPKVDQVITFDAGTSTADSEGVTNDVIISYIWNFGDGAKSLYTGANLTSTATHSYAKYGNYTVTLTVVDGEELNATTTKFVLASRITSGVTISTNTTTIQVGQSVTISGQITPPRSGTIVSILYRVGTGAWTPLQNVTTDQSGNYQYAWLVNTAGDYTVKAQIGSDNKYTSAASLTTTVQVQSVSPPNNGGVGFDWTLYIVAGFIAVVLVIGVGYYLVKRRK